MDNTYTSLIRAIYFIMVSRTGHGSGDILPHNKYEILVSILSMALGDFMLCAMLAYMTALAESLDFVKSEYAAQNSIIDGYLMRQSCVLPESFVKIIQDHRN
jgi:hypothetical protein